MCIAYTPEEGALRDELRAYFATIMTPEVEAEVANGDTGKLSKGWNLITNQLNYEHVALDTTETTARELRWTLAPRKVAGQEPQPWRSSRGVVDFERLGGEPCTIAVNDPAWGPATAQP